MAGKWARSVKEEGILEDPLFLLFSFMRTGRLDGTLNANVQLTAIVLPFHRVSESDATADERVAAFTGAARHPQSLSSPCRFS